MSGRREASDPAALELLAELDEITTAMEANAAAGEVLMARRNGVFLRLKEHEVTHREIAAHAKLTEMAVKKAIDKTQREAAAV